MANEEGIDLRCYINSMIKRKWVIIAVFLVSVIATFVFSTTIPKIYESSAVVEIGRIGVPENALQYETIMDKTNAIDTIKSDEVLESVIGGDNYNVVVRIEDIPKTMMLRVVVEANDSEIAKKMCEGIINKYVTYANKLYNEKKKIPEEQLLYIQEWVDKTKKNIAETELMLSMLSKDKENLLPEKISKVILLHNNLSNYGQLLINLMEERSKLVNIMINAKQFEIKNFPKEQKHPIKPRRARMLILYAMLGLIAGVFVAFFIEYWQMYEK